MFVTWNLSRKARAFDQTDAFVISVPKSGRTWLRVFLSKYLAELKEQQIELFDASPVQKIKYTHDFLENRAEPRDLMASLYFQLTKRSFGKHSSDFSGTLSELLVDKKLVWKKWSRP